jgi:hypothetical protein
MNSVGPAKTRRHSTSRTQKPDKTTKEPNGLWCSRIAPEDDGLLPTILDESAKSSAMVRVIRTSVWGAREP